MKSWKIINSGKHTAFDNMLHDYQLLESLSSSEEPILHFYDWEGDCATYGYFTSPYHYLNENGVRKWGLNLAKRPTGGGIILHMCDLAFSVLLPSSHPSFSLNTLENYSFVNRKVGKAIERFLGSKKETSLLPQEPPVTKKDGCFHFCMAKPTQYDIIIEGKKVGGAAQRRTKQGFLHQGSIALTLPSRDYLGDILKDGAIIDAMQRQSYLLLGVNPSQNTISETRQELSHLLSRVFQDESI